MICVRIDVAKDKHDRFIMSLESEVLANLFIFQNNVEGLDTLFQAIHLCAYMKYEIKVEDEASGHYSHNILGFFLDKGRTSDTSIR